MADPAYVGTNAITPLKTAGGELNDYAKAYIKQVKLIRSALEEPSRT